MEKNQVELDVDNQKPTTPRNRPSNETTYNLPVAQLFLKIIAAQIEVKEEEPKFSKQIQDSDLVVQTKYNYGYKTNPATGSLMPQWHAGYTFAVRDLNTSLKLKLISTKRLINTTLGKVDIPLEVISDTAKVVELPLEKFSKKLKSVKIMIITMCARVPLPVLTQKYSVITNSVWHKTYSHPNSPYFTPSKGITDMHPSFKIVLERANYIAGEVVRGAVVLDVGNTMDNVNFIKLSATATESSKWTVGSGSNEVTYTGAREIFSLSQHIIWSPKRDGLTLFSGMHVYPFELQLPITTPTSMEYGGASMTYLITAHRASMKGTKTATAFFNVYGPETRFQSPLVLTNPTNYLKKLVKDDWTGEVLLSSEKHYPNREYGIFIKYHNADRIPVRSIKVSMKLLVYLRGGNASDTHRTYPLLNSTVSMNENKNENVQLDFRYKMPVVPPTVAPGDGISLFQFHTIAKITVNLANLKKSRRVVPITVGTIIPEHVTQEHHVINPDASVASLTVYCAKSAMVHGLVCYKSTSLQFFDDKIFTSYDKTNLVRIEHGAEVNKEEVVVMGKMSLNNSTNNMVMNSNSNNNLNNSSVNINNSNNNTNSNNTNPFRVEEDRPMSNVEEDKPKRSKYVVIDDDEVPDSDESDSI